MALLPIITVPGGPTRYLSVKGSGTVEDPFVTVHQEAGGTPVALEVVPTSGGVQLPSTPCKFVVLKNQTGSPIQYGFAAGVPLFTLLNNFDERIDVDNADKLWIFDADNQGLTFRGYAIQ